MIPTHPCVPRACIKHFLQAEHPWPLGVKHCFQSSLRLIQRLHPQAFCGIVQVATVPPPASSEPGGGVLFFAN